MRNRAALTTTLAFGLHAALAATATAAPASLSPACSVTSTVERDGTSISLTTLGCGAEERADHVGFLDRAMAFIFGGAPSVPAPALAPGERAIPEIPSIRPGLGPIRPDEPSPAPGRAEATGLGCSVDVRGVGQMKQVGVILRSDRGTAVTGEFEVSVVGNGTRRFRQGIDTPIELKAGQDEFVVLAHSNVRGGDTFAGSVTLDDGKTMECDAPK